MIPEFIENLVRLLFRNFMSGLLFYVKKAIISGFAKNSKRG